MKLKDKLGIGIKWDMNNATIYAILKYRKPFTAIDISRCQPPGCNYTATTLRSNITNLYDSGFIEKLGKKNKAQLYEINENLIELAKKNGIIDQKPIKPAWGAVIDEAEWKEDIESYKKLRQKSKIIGIESFTQNFRQMVEFTFADGNGVCLPETIAAKLKKGRR